MADSIITTKFSRRDFLRTSGNAGILVGAIAVPITAHAMQGDGLIEAECTDGFGSWYFLPGDRLLVEALAKPMQETGLYVADLGDGPQMVHAAVPVSVDGQKSDVVFIKRSAWEISCLIYDPRQDAPLGHRIVWYQPTYTSTN